MTEFYYQIKGKSNDIYSSHWIWPPIFTGKVEAKNKKEAKMKIEEEYERTFPLRVLRKDLKSADFLLKIQEIEDSDDRTKNLFELKTCKECQKKFKIIDKYNDHNESSKDPDFCSYDCKEKYKERNRTFDPTKSKSEEGCSGYIYKITNKNNGKSYIGKTINAFTFRWYKHFYYGTGTKFHNAIKNSEVTDWIFEVIEVVKTPDDKLASEYILERESCWIKEYNSIEEGYNSLISDKTVLEE